MGRTMVLTEKSTALQRPWTVRGELEMDAVDFIERFCRLAVGMRSVNRSRSWQSAWPMSLLFLARVDSVCV